MQSEHFQEQKRGVGRFHQSETRRKALALGHIYARLFRRAQSARVSWTHIKLRGKSRAMADGCRLRNGSGMVGRQSTSCCKPVTKIPTTVKAARGRRHTPCLFHAVMLEPMPNRVARYNQLRPVHGPNMLQRPLSRHNDATTPQGHHFSNTINKTSIQIKIRMTVKLM